MPFGLFSKKQTAVAEEKKDKPKVDEKSTRALVIFDFDGTLADSLAHLLASINGFAKEKNFKLDEVKTYQDVLAITKNINPISLVELYANKKKIVARIMDGLAENIKHTTLFSGLKETITQLHTMGMVVGIVTTNRIETVYAFLKQHDLTDSFRFVKASEGEFKTKLLQDVVKEHKQENGDVFYITGRTDYVSTVRQKKIGAKSVGVSWGYDSHEAFNKEKVDHIASDPAHLLDIVSKKEITQEVELPMAVGVFVDSKEEKSAPSEPLRP